MANYSAIKAAVNAYIKANGKKEITGRILNSVLNATIDSLGRFFQFAGEAMPTDDPGTPDQNVCYLAGEPGLYTHFGNIRIANEEVALLFWNGEWVKESIALGIQEVTASVDNQVGTPSVDVFYSGGQLVLTFHNLKGEQGIQGIQGVQGEQGVQGVQGDQGVKGDTGAAAGFGTIGADITGGVGTPGVSVESSGDNTSKNLMFHFTNLKGETGVTSVVATIDNTSGTPSCQVSLVNGVLTLAFSGLKGLKGDTGVSADYPITLYNGLDSDATDQALAAAQGVVLDGKISQLQQEVYEKIGKVAIPVTESGKAIYMNGGVGSTIGAPVTSSYSYSRYPVTPGNIVIVNGNGGGSPRLWGFVDANGVILSVADGSVAEKDLWLTVPANAAEVIINTNNLTVPCYYYDKGSVEYELDEFEGRVEGIPLSMRYNKTINLSGGVGTTVPSPVTVVGWGYFDHSCDEGSRLLVSGSGGSYGLWAFVDSDNKILSWSGGTARADNLTVVAPENSVRVVGNIYNYGNYPAPKIFLSTSLIGQIETLASEIEGVGAGIGKLLVEKTVSPTFVTGKYITWTGNIANLSGYEYGSFDAEAGDIIIVKFTFATGNLAAISVANSDLSVIMPKIQAITGEHEYQYICTEDCKVVISGVTADLSYKVIHSRIDEQIQDSGLPTAIQRVFPDFTINNSSYWNKSGAISSLSGWIRTSGAFLKKGTVISLYWGGNSNPYISIITEVDEQGGFLRACLLTPNPNVAGELKFVVDKDGYYSISNAKDDFYRYQIIYFANGDLFFNPPLDHLFLPTQDGLPREILRSPSFVGIVHKWGFIGDSLSSGEQAVKKDGTSTIERFDLYDYSWGQRLCRLNSVEGFNFSVGGQTTKGWCNGTNERTWAGAQLQENWKEAYCIALGVNDRSALSPGDADTDINLSDYTQNADTFAGWYAGIIQRLRSVNPKCRIFCITIPYNNQQGYLDNNEVIRAIVPKFNKCYLVDLANYHWTPEGLALNDHLSPAGYQWAAWEINTYIDWIIRNNMDDFKDIAWVGTEYSA